MSMNVSAKDRKYDRQLRLWAANGQHALEDTHICLLSASATGAEILKNLVLPGAGAFTILDNQLVSQADLDANFFLDDSCLMEGHNNRAERVAEFLQELNSDSKGNFEIKDPTTLDRLSDEYWNKYTLVIAYRLRPSVLMKVSAKLWEKDIPLVVCNTVGFYGYLRTAVPEHTIVESHPDSTVDLRLDCPWPELEDYANSLDLDKMDEVELAHVPYVLLLLVFLEKWKADHGGQAPQDYKQKNDFKESIRKHSRTPDEENFEEAVNAVWRATQQTTVSTFYMF